MTTEPMPTPSCETVSAIAYEFSGIPLTPSNAEKIIFLCCSGTMPRSDIVKRVYEYHMSNGGVDSGTNKTHTVKKALAQLVIRGDIPVQASKGYYSIPNDRPIDVYEASAIEDIQSEDDPFLEIPGALYAYYFPAYERLASLNGDSFWPIKIGQTDRYVSDRIASQSTAFPEKPILLFSINTEIPRILERAVHYILKTRGKNCNLENDESVLKGGSEWFMTNPSELFEILDFLYIDYDKD